MQPSRTPWETIVIGSGSGGLTAAAALARNGQRVLVLEQHYLPGGWCHSFLLGGYKFSPGVHYISDCGPGGAFRRLCEGLGLCEDIEFCEINPDAFDHLLVAGKRLDVPKGADRLVQRLVSLYPHERSGIDKYFAVLSKLADDLSRCDRLLQFPQILKLPWVAPTLTRWGIRTLKPLLDSTLRDPLLKAYLLAQSGNHGLPPERVSLPLHAGMTLSYLNGGAYYPRGGARRIPRALIAALRRHGGQVRVGTRVHRILTQRNRAVGVELETGERIAASNVISNADPATTFGKLLGGRPGRRERRKSQRMEYSVSMISLFCAVELDLRRLGLDSGNWWWYRHADVGDLYGRMERELRAEAPIDGLFLSVTTLKDPQARPGHHTIEMFTFVPYEPFARWEGTHPEHRGPQYDTLKQRIGDRMIEAAENVIPGIGRAIRFRAVGTPLTNDFYCETTRGAAYGTAKTPWQMGPFSFGTTTTIDGLYLCGASTLSHGVAATALSGLMAAQRVLGASGTQSLLGPSNGPLRVFPAEHPEQWLEQARSA